jgi:hypothetical protein
MSFFKSLFAGGKSGGAPAAKARAEHKGFLIEATPYLEAGQYQLAGVISKAVDGEHKQYRFVRADRFGSPDEAAARALDKGRQLVDEQGEALLR